MEERSARCTERPVFRSFERLNPAAPNSLFFSMRRAPRALARGGASDACVSGSEPHEKMGGLFEKIVEKETVERTAEKKKGSVVRV